MDIAASIQKVTEEIVIKMVKETKKLTNSKNLCFSGGVALNCVANGKIEELGIFEKIWIYSLKFNTVKLSIIII